MKAFVTLLFVSISSLLLTGCPTYQSVQMESHQGEVHHPAPYFSKHDRARIKGYYLYNYPHMYRLPPGQLKKHYRKFKPRHPLSQNIHYSRLPYEIERRLPPLPANYIRIRVGDDIAIMNRQTRIIYDAIWLFE